MRKGYSNSSLPSFTVLLEVKPTAEQQAFDYLTPVDGGRKTKDELQTNTSFHSLW